MDNDELVAMVIQALKDDGSVVVNQEWMNMLTNLLHQNVEIIGIIKEMDDCLGGMLSEHLTNLADRLTYVAFTVEQVAHEQE